MEDELVEIDSIRILRAQPLLGVSLNGWGPAFSQKITPFFVAWGPASSKKITLFFVAISQHNK